MSRCVFLPCALLIGLSGAVSAQAGEPQSTPEGLRPFTAQTNYMSLHGYLRLRKYLQTGQWTPLPFPVARGPLVSVVIPDVTDPFYIDKRTTIKSGTVVIDLGEIEGFLRGGVPKADEVLAKSVQAYPNGQVLVLLWSHTLTASVNVEGVPFYKPLRHQRVIYDRRAQKLTVQSSATKDSWGLPHYEHEGVSEQMLMERVHANARNALENLFKP